MKLLRRTIILINVILILSLILGFLRQFIHPAQLSFLTIFSLLYPYTVILLSIFLVITTLIRSPWVWISLLALVLTSGNTVRQIGFHVTPEIPEDTTVYTMSSLNIKNNFRHNQKDQSSAFIEDFKNKNSDFLVLQEISGNQIKKVAEALGYPYGSHMDNQFKSSYLAVFSRYPLRMIKTIKNAEGRIVALVSDIELREGVIRLFNIHLHTNAVTIRAENFSPESFSRKEGLKAFNDMLQSYSRNASLRMKEIELINNEIDKSPVPVIVAGDSNDTPFSPGYRKLKGSKQNAFEKSGLGFAQTYNGLIVPLKIDHIFLDKPFYIYDTSIEKIDYSDHNPITISFSFNN